MSVSRLSERVHGVVEQEREVVAARLEALRAQAHRLHAIVDDVDADVAETAHLLRRMDEMLGIAPQLSLEAQGELRGQKLQEVAVELLRQKKGAGVAVHYRDWFALMVDAGIEVAGKDPLSTFLTQVARSAAVESVRPRSGLYRLRFSPWPDEKHGLPSGVDAGTYRCSCTQLHLKHLQSHPCEREAASKTIPRDREDQALGARRRALRVLQRLPTRGRADDAHPQSRRVGTQRRS